MGSVSQCMMSGRAMEVKLEMVTVEAEADGLGFSLVCFLPETGSSCSRRQAAWELTVLPTVLP